jgi:acyl transferase domain-containing protein/acyl carrier protein
MTERRDLLRESLAAIERLQARIEASEAAAHAPIAIVGAGCRYPGRINDLSSLWRVVRDGIDAVGKVPADRWDADAYYDADPNQFDPQFFGISPREALTMDPQHRLLLETAYEALENAAIAPDTLARSATGVFVGITTGDYGQLLRAGSPDSTDVYSATGTALNAAAGRLSFTLGLHGPCVAIDTACSSSLVAVHLACQSLRNGESDLALAGGVNVILSPDAMVLFSKWGMMAPDGACKTFDAAADGFVRAEGCAVVALKRLSAAVEAGDPILAVIRGSAVNSDGRSSGLTVPNGLAQQAVIRSALASARLRPSDIDYVEAHGTGTSLGDPIEIEALGAVYGESREPAKPVIIGSIKTNIGHAEAASGIAGLLKVIAQLRHGSIAPHLHFKTPNPGIRWEDFPIEVPTVLTPWEGGERTHRAGVSSFGFSGTNAHVILEEAPPIAQLAIERVELLPRIVPLSARTEPALRDAARRLSAMLEQSGDNDAPGLADIASTLSNGRTHHASRAAILCESKDELRGALSAIQHGTPSSNSVRGEMRSGERRKTGFMFTGQGSQYSGMGRGLYDSEPIFRAVLDRAAEALKTKLESPLLDVMFNDENSHLLAETVYTQPALYTIGYALAELWRSWGIEPAIVTGHSVGEYAAACVAGVFSFEDGLALVAERGRLMQALPKGAMAAIFCGQEAVSEHVAAYADRLAIAGVNGPEETVLSGDVNALTEVLVLLDAKGIKSRRLDVSHAFHSPLLDPMLGPFEAYAKTIVHKVPRIPLVSNVGGTIFLGQGPDASYWARHAREAVNFVACMGSMRTSGVKTMLEIGPHPTLLALDARAQPSASWTAVSSLRRGRNDRREILASLAAVYERGADVRWPAVSAAAGGRRVSLPTYPFQRERYWADAPDGKTNRGSDSGHPLLGERHDLASIPGSYVWQRELSLRTHPWLLDHRVEDTAIVPATAYIEMAFAAGREVMSSASLAIHNLENRKPIILHEGQKRLLQVILIVTVEGTAEFNAYSRAINSENAGWVLHASASVTATEAPEEQDGFRRMEAARARCDSELTGTSFYTSSAVRGNQWGPSFRGVNMLWLADDEAVGRIEIPASLSGEIGRYLFHPALSDACGHPLAGIISRSWQSGAFVGGGVKEIRLHRAVSSSPIWAHAKLRSHEGDARTRIGDVSIYDNTGALVSETRGARLWFLDEDMSSSLIGAPREWYHQVEWNAKPKSSKGPRSIEPGPWLVFADRSGLGAAIANLRSKTGEDTILVMPGNEWSMIGQNVTIRPDCASDYLRLLRAIGQPKAILYLWSVDIPHDHVADALGASMITHVEQTLLLLQSVRVEPSTRPRMWFVTSGAQKVAVGDTSDAPNNATLWGLCRALTAEYAELWGGIIDVDSFGLSETVHQIVREVENGDIEDKVALRLGKRYVPRLVHRPPVLEDGGDFVPRPDATYLVSGGLGGIGLEISRWLVERGARHLLLLGRTSPPPTSTWSSLDHDAATRRKIASIEAMNSLGAVVEVAAVDIAAKDELERCLEKRAARGAPNVAGVIHAAGVLKFEALEEQSLVSLRAGLSAKVAGAWNLHCQFEHQPLDFFVMCSSSSALLNSPLLGGYAAGNAFLDALAEYRQARGLRALSVNWGTWGEVGMAAATGRGDLLAGFATIGTARGLAALGKLLKSGSSRAAIMPVNWNVFARTYPAFASDPFLETLVGALEIDFNRPTTFALSRSVLLAVEQPEQVRLLLQYLHAEAARILGIKVNELDTAAPLPSLGFDSLMAVQLKNGIETDLGVSVPMIQFLQGPSIEEVVPSILGAIIAFDPPSMSKISIEESQVEWEEGSL